MAKEIVSSQIIATLGRDHVVQTVVGCVHFHTKDDLGLITRVIDGLLESEDTDHSQITEKEALSALIDLCFSATDYYNNLKEVGEI